MQDKAFNIAKSTNCDRYQRRLASVVYKSFDKKNSGSGIKNENILNKELAEELHKPIFRNLKKRKENSFFIDNIWAADLAHMQFVSKFNKGFRFLLCDIDIFSKHAWVIPLKVKKNITITNGFLKILNESNCKPNNIWVDQGSEFRNRSVKSWLDKSHIEIYSQMTKENLLLLKDSLEPYRTKFISI